MKVCIYGAGAIGGYLGVELARAGAEVSLVARGGHLEAMQTNGVKLLINGEERVARVRATDDPAELGPQDYVIIALKAHSVPSVVEKMRPLLGNDTSVVTAVNGVPYWYFYKHGGALENRTLETIDPAGRQWEVLRPERALGCIVYPATEVVAPGVIQHIYGDKFPLGEPSGEVTPRVKALAELMESAGLRAPVMPNIRDELWLKLWGNLCFNPISALTHATLDVIAADPGTRAVARGMMLEAQAIAEKLGIRFRVDVERRINGAGAVGAHKTSMLQDLERDRPMEIDPLVSVVQEMGRMLDMPTPTLDTVLALVRQRAAISGLGGHLASPPLTAADLPIGKPH
ncbi:2-dehydropantoate 2-reductase [Xanthobacter tagetidis]|uniref:2-dehydropantoate 2-reductase n=1 Tax=Xanthobacter tagetidis TaxID=60216 RepID=A0A3L6ZU17_9HYPH|nr:2-dehydropantoate 2-reductase [Xanthobacter tagetidis]MBB6309977.1 2-dehydropantoate 2-reductase [Xanthobacter tagetidis]RLP71299.1 2-dehydropantoate 2-reductase [Xanthobacter tagetidis]